MANYEVIEKKEKIQIIIKSVGKPRPWSNGKGQSVKFASGYGISYDCLNGPLQEYLKVGETITGDVELRAHTHEGQTYQDWFLTEIYINDKPVGRSSRARSSYSKPVDPLERPSIEAQTAYNGIIALAAAGKLAIDHDIVAFALKWARGKMEFNLKPAPVPEAPRSLPEKAAPAATTLSEPATTAKPKPVEAPPPETEATAPGKPASNPSKISLAMIHELGREAKKQGYTNKTIGPLILFFGVQKAEDLTVEQGKLLLEKIKDREGLPQEPISLL